VPTSILNCTFVENQVIAGAGGQANGDGTLPGLPGTATASTFNNNGPAATSFGNSIISIGSETNDFSGAFVDAGHNLVNGPIAGFISPTSFTNTDPRLIEVNVVGGLPFYRPSPDSPARDALPANEAPAIDQRGVVRPAGGAADIGAIELALLEIPPLITLDASASISLIYTGNPPNNYALFTTTDFHSWSAVVTNRADNAGHVLFGPFNRFSSPFEFYLMREVSP
jgi:hypothetical protein